MRRLSPAPARCAFLPRDGLVGARPVARLTAAFTADAGAGGFLRHSI